MAIKILITLEGSEQVKSALDGMSRSGEAFMRQISGIGGAGTSPLQGLGDGFTKLTPAIAGSREATRGFHELMLVMNPILRTAGVELSAFVGFSRLASVGIGGLAVAITTGIIVALSKLADSTAVAQKRLETLLNIKPGTGAGAMAGLEATAAKLGSTTSTVQPIIEKFVGALRQVNAATGAVWMAPPGQSLPAILAKDFAQAEPAALALFEAIRTGGATQEKAAQEATRFADALAKAGKVNGDVIRTLDPLGGGVKAIGEALGLGGLNAEQLADRLDKTPRSVDNLYKGLIRLKPEIDKAFETRPVTEFDDALGKVSTSWGNLWKEFSSSKFAVGFLDIIARMPEDLLAAIDAMKKDWEDFTSWVSKLKPTPSQFGGQQANTQLARDLGIQDISNNFGEIELKSEQVAQGVLLDWSTAAGNLKGPFEIAGKAIELVFDQIQQKAKQTTSGVSGSVNFFMRQVEGQKWVTPGGEESALPPSAKPIAFTGAPIDQTQQTTQTLVAPFQEADNQIRTIWMDLVEYIGNALSEIDLSALTTTLVAPFQEADNQIRTIWIDLIDYIQNSLSQIKLSVGGSPGGNVFIETASGGYIRGPGTTTSDSIPAWLSNREYVVRAKAVDHYGPNLFAALNSMRLPKDLFSHHFAIGGLAKALSNAMPRYATGGMATASAGRSLTIVLDGQRFGVSGSSDVIDRLERVATMAGIASIGRPPGWVR